MLLQEAQILHDRRLFSRHDEIETLAHQQPFGAVGCRDRGGVGDLLRKASQGEWACEQRKRTCERPCGQGEQDPVSELSRSAGQGFMWFRAEDVPDVFREDALVSCECPKCSFERCAGNERPSGVALTSHWKVDRADLRALADMEWREDLEKAEAHGVPPRSGRCQSGSCVASSMNRSRPFGSTTPRTVPAASFEGTSPRSTTKTGWYARSPI